MACIAALYPKFDNLANPIFTEQGKLVTDEGLPVKTNPSQIADRRNNPCISVTNRQSNVKRLYWVTKEENA